MSGQDFIPHQKLRIMLHYLASFVFELWLSWVVLPLPLELIHHCLCLFLLTGESCYGASSMLVDVVSCYLFNVLINTALFKPIWRSYAAISSHCTPRRIPLSLRSCVFIFFWSILKMTSDYYILDSPKCIPSPGPTTVLWTW